jgi:hypothetical protein
MTAPPKMAILVELGCWLTLALVAFALSFQFSSEPGTYKWGAASWPRAVVLLMAVTAIVHAAVRYQEADRQATGGDDETRTLLASIGLFLIPLVYVWLLPRTGFYLTTPFFLIALLLYAGERRIGAIAATTAIIVFCIYLVFAKLFYVALPIGNWPVFYDINNWLLIAIR